MLLIQICRLRRGEGGREHDVRRGFTEFLTGLNAFIHVFVFDDNEQVLLTQSTAPCADLDQVQSCC